MSKSELFRLKIQREAHIFRRRKAEEMKEANNKEFKDEVDRFRRGVNDQELGSSVHEEQPPVCGGSEGQ